VFALVYGLPKESYVFLLLVFGLVLFAELINSAMEALVNINSSHYNYFARNAKDIAAGAVLITAILSVVIAVIIFSDLEKLKNAICIVFCSPMNTIALLFWIIISYIFIKGVKK
jgi:diacylglycerol kinase (ATP)